MEKKKWIVSIIDDAYRIKMKKFHGTIEEAKRMLLGLIKEDRDAMLTTWNDGTEATSDIEERMTNGEVTSLYGFNFYSGIYHDVIVHYHAHVEDNIEEISDPATTN